MKTVHHHHPNVPYDGFNQHNENMILLGKNNQRSMNSPLPSTLGGSHQPSSNAPERLPRNEGSIVSSEEPIKAITFKIFFTNKRAMLAIVASIFAMIFMLFFDSILSLRLVALNLNPDYIGYVFALGAFLYALSAPFVGMLCRIIPRRYVT